MPAEPVPDRSLLPERARPVKADLRPGVDLPDYLPARMLNEYVYCPRLFFYEWVEGVFAHSGDTVEGALRHEKLGEKEDALPEPAAAGEERIHSRSVMLSSDSHHLIARIDLVEGDAGAVVPVDYKRGEPRATDDGPQAWPADRAQVCAHALILRDNGYRCDEAVAYSLLVRDLTIVCHAIGFDPFIGFYHQPRFGRPALALDLMEGFTRAI